MSFMGGGGGEETPVMPGYGNKKLLRFMASWRKQQRSKQGMESTVLGDWGGDTSDSMPNTVLGDSWLNK